MCEGLITEEKQGMAKHHKNSYLKSHPRIVNGHCDQHSSMNISKGPVRAMAKGLLGSLQYSPSSWGELCEPGGILGELIAACGGRHGESRRQGLARWRDSPVVPRFARKRASPSNARSTGVSHVGCESLRLPPPRTLRGCPR